MCCTSCWFGGYEECTCEDEPDPAEDNRHKYIQECPDCGAIHETLWAREELCPDCKGE